MVPKVWDHDKEEVREYGRAHSRPPPGWAPEHSPHLGLRHPPLVQAAVPRVTGVEEEENEEAGPGRGTGTDAPSGQS